MLKKFSCLSAFVWLVFCAQTSFGQLTTASMSGVARDDTGAVLPGVTIRVKNLDTGATRTGITDDEGRYRASSLSVGSYEAQAELAGFQTSVRTGIELTVGRDAIVDFTLKVGQVTEKVVVTGEAPLVETTSSTVTGLVSSQQMTELPLNGRDFTQLALLETGTTNVRNTDNNVNKGYGTRISVAGSRPSQTGYLLDGTDINSFVNFGVPGSAAGVLLGVDAVREFQVQTSNFSAEFGRATGGVLNMVTKSGTNEFHGTVFMFHRNDNLDARNFFATAKPEFKRHQFGFSAGGPIRKDKTFVFGTFEGLREARGLSFVAIVPDDNARRGFLPDGRGGLRFVGVSEVIRPFLEQLYPLPNGPSIGGGAATFSSSNQRIANEDFLMVRVDHAISEKDSLFVRYTFDDGEETTPNTIPISSAGQANRSQYTTIQEQHTFSPNLLNTFTVAYNRTFLGTLSELLKPITVGYRPGGVIGGIGITGFTEIVGIVEGSNSRIGYQNLFHYLDTLAYRKGAHSLKFGADVERIQYNEDAGTAINGSFSFSNLEDFLLARSPRQFSGDLPGSDARRGWRQSLYGFFIQDDLQARRSLTLNLGLRYQFYTVPKEVNGKLSHIRNFVKDAAPTIGDPFWVNPSFTNFAPRIGLAWDPFGDGKSSIRAAYGMFFVMMTPAAYRTAGVRTPPFFYDIFTIQNPVGFPSFDTVMVNEIARLGNVGTVASPYSIQFDLDSQYEQKFNLTLEREIVRDTVLTVGYLGGRGIHLLRRANGNQAPSQLINGRWGVLPGTPRLNPAFNASMVTNRSEGQSFYNGFQLKVNKRMGQAMQVRGSYTWSKSIDETGVDAAVSDFAGNQGYSTIVEFKQVDRGLSPTDARHNLVVSWVYELPVGSTGRGVAKALLGGWQVNGIWSLSSGNPFTASLPINWVPTGARLGQQRPDLVPGASNNPINAGNPDQYFGVEAFRLPPLNTFGNLGRNTFIGPGFANLDFGLTKNMAIREDFRIQFRGEFFNVLNRANFRNPASNVLDARGVKVPNAGKITSTSGTERDIQLGLKILW